MVITLFFFLHVLGSEQCAPSFGSSVEDKDGFVRIKNLAVVRSGLELTNPENDYKSAGSNRSAFQVACKEGPFFERPVVAGSFGLSKDQRPFGEHYLAPVKQLPHCDMNETRLAVMINRDWYRNIWHRVANDLYPAYKALHAFGLENTPKSDLVVIHLDFSEKTFEELYNLVLSPNSIWMRDLPKEKNVVCFSDVLFMVSRHWSSTFPEYPVPNMVAPNPLVIGFGRWTVDRIGLRKVRTPLQHGGLPAITWISRKPLYGNRAFKNEEEMSSLVRQHFNGSATLNVVDLELLSFAKQVELIRSTDVLFGAHGAGLTHILFLQPHAAVFETLPYQFEYRFYERVAKLSGKRYVYWQEKDPAFMVEETWKPHTKFSNFVLRLSEIIPGFEQALSYLPQKKRDEL